MNNSKVCKRRNYWGFLSPTLPFDTDGYGWPFFRRIVSSPRRLLIPRVYAETGNRETLKSKETLPASINFDNVDDVFRERSTMQLLGHYLILKMCSWNWFVDHAPQILTTLEKWHLSAPAYWVVKHTFFRHFCAGETIESGVAAASNLKKLGISTILDYSVEADKKLHPFDTVVEKLIETIKEGARQRNTLAFSCFKMTALTEPEFLETFSKVLHSYEKNPNLERPVWWSLQDSSTNLQEVANTMEKLASDSHNTQLDSKNALEFARLVRRLEKLLTVAYNHKIPILVDAEQSYYQKAIDWFTLALSKRFNKETPIVYNTYQMYLKDGLSKLQRDMEVAKTDQYFFAAKVRRIKDNVV